MIPRWKPILYLERRLKKGCTTLSTRKGRWRRYIYQEMTEGNDSQVSHWQQWSVFSVPSCHEFSNYFFTANISFYNPSRRHKSFQNTSVCLMTSPHHFLPESVRGDAAASFLRKHFPFPLEKKAENNFKTNCKGRLHTFTRSAWLTVINKSVPKIHCGNSTILELHQREGYDGEAINLSVFFLFSWIKLQILRKLKKYKKKNTLILLINYNCYVSRWATKIRSWWCYNAR